MPRLTFHIAMIAAAVFVAGGCSGTTTMSQEEAEKQISAALEEQVGEAPDDIACPDDITAEVGETMECELTDGDDVYGVTMTITEVEGDKALFDVEVDEEPKS